MSFKALAWVSELKTGNAGSKLVLFTLAQFSDEQGCCWPSQKTIAEFAECSERTVRGHLADLEASGLIARTSRTRPNGSFTSDVFQLNLKQLILQPAANSAVGKKQQNPAAKSAAPEPVIPTTNVVGEPVIGAFEQFWSAYPKKVGKDAAARAWKKAAPKIDDVLHALIWQAKSDQWTKDGGQYIPNPATYLNQGRWKDEPATRQSSKSTKGGTLNEQRAHTIAALTGGAAHAEHGSGVIDGSARQVD